MPHIDLVEQSINYSVPADKMCELADFDGSVSIQRTRGTITARCHEEEANFLALNLAHEIVQGEKTVQEARDFYTQSVLAFRTNKPAPYMEKLLFTPQEDTGEPDHRTMSEQDMQAIKEKAMSM